MKNRKLVVMCVAGLCVGGYALAQDRGFDVPINSGLNVPIPTGKAAVIYYFDGMHLRKHEAQTAPKSRADGMTAEQIAAALDAVRVQKEALDQWERELRTAALSKRVASWGVMVDRPAPPAHIQGFGVYCGLFGGQ